MNRFKATSQSDPGMIQSMPRPDVIEALQSDRLCSIQVLEQACAAYADRPALGERALAPDGRPLPAFRAISYQTLWRRTADLATGLARDPRTALAPGEIAGIYGFGSIDYAVADMACLHAGVASAVLQVGMATQDLEHIINEARLATVFCARESLGDIVGLLPRCPSVRSLVVMEARAGTVPQAALPLAAMAELEASGRASAPLKPFIPAAGTDPLATLMYTSGSTGFPKGALMTERVWREHWRLRWLGQYTQFPAISLSFYPLSHVLGRNTLVRTLVLGGVTHFTLKSDLSTLFEDIRLVRPTFLNLVPRISEMIHQAFRAEVRKRAGAGLAPAAARAAVSAEWRGAFLGDRLLAAMVGSAPTAPEIVAWISECFEIPVYEGYGSTEGGVVTIDGEISRPAVIAYRLEEQPELGYRLSDQPWPRGELQVKTLQSVPGYFNNPEATRALYTGDGFLRTGDIVEERGPGRVAWIDRKNNVLKLAQGEFVTIWRLESTFSGGSPCLDQVYLYADSRRAFLLAVVVPAWDAVNERLGLEGRDAPAAVKRLLRAELNRIAAEARLRPFEVPRDFLVEPGRWTRENGFLTGINKHARPKLKQRYGERLEALYARIDQERELDPGALGLLDPGLPLAEKALRAVSAVLGVPDPDLAACSFKDLGGDSVSALTLALLLEEACGAPVPAAAVLNPGRPLLDLVRELESGPAADALPGFGAIHGRQAAWIRAEDLRLDRFLRPADLAGAAAVAAQPLGPVRTVLLTGASGFLGHILCLEWMEQMAKLGGRVWAIVRAADDAAAAERLRAACRCDPGLERRFALLAGRHLTALAGDLAAPGLGLAAPIYERLAIEADLIVHAGALVNHVYSYQQLFEPNVLGTAQLIRLALSRHRKRFDYISTIGVLEGARGPGKALEADGVAALRTEWPASGGYAHGYATSKWASEVLLRELHERFDAPVRVFRPGMILPDRRYRGQVNVSDMLSRLLASIVRTGLAPRSFLADGPGARDHYDGLPVDFIAAAVAALSSAHQPGQATFQVSNDWDDGVGLDTLIDWVETAGHPLERMDDYGAWYAAFSARLQGLPAGERQRTSLPILHQWAEPGRGGEAGRADATRFRREVSRRKPGGEARLPHLTEAYLHKYLEDLQALGVIQP